MHLNRLTPIFRVTSSVELGDVLRHDLILNTTLDPPLSSISVFQLQIRNTLNIFYNAAFLKGPYHLTASIISHDGGDPYFISRIQCGATWTTQLKLPSGATQAHWTIEVASEALFQRVSVPYEMTLLVDNGNDNGINNNDDDGESEKDEGYSSPAVKHITNKLLEPQELPQSAIEGVHLVVLTHGLHGSRSDLLYIKDQIESRYEKEGGRVVVWTCDANHGLTTEGIATIGQRVADRILSYLQWPEQKELEETYTSPIAKISFIGHSLGGLVNLWVIGRMHAMTSAKIFTKIQARYFITLATPWLGSFEQPWLIRSVMQTGALGQSGKDLVLMKREDGREPIIWEMAQPSSDTKTALGMFEGRTVYGNYENDLAVKFKTSVIWFQYAWERNREESTVDAPKLEKPPNFPAPQPSLFRELTRTFTVPATPLEALRSEPSRIPSPIIKDILCPPWVRSDSTTNEYEKLAQFWHQDLSFRTVVVKLPPDAHTGIVVKRRFGNAGPGWAVIEHLIKEHPF